MGANTPSEDRIDDENLEKMTEEERARLFWAASRAKRLKPSNEPMPNAGNTEDPGEGNTGGEPFDPYNESDGPASNVISMPDRFGRASARKIGAKDLKGSSNAPEDKMQKKIGIGLGDAKDPDAENRLGEQPNPANQLGGNRELIEQDNPDIISGAGPNAKAQNQQEIANDLEVRKARDRMRTQQYNAATAPIGKIMSLKNFRQIRELKKTIKKIAERIQKNNKQIKKLRPPSLLKKTFMYTGRALLDLITVGTSETIITPVQIVRSLKQQDNKIKANKLRNINKELGNQIKKLELQIYNLQNVFKMEEADEQTPSAESKKKAA